MKFSLTFFKEDFLSLLLRFKWAVFFSVLLTSVSLIWAWDIFGRGITEYSFRVAIYYCSVGMLLSLVIRLWLEDEVATKQQRMIAAGAHALLLLDAVWLWKMGELSMELTYAHGSGIVGLLLAMFYLPFFRQKDDIQSWNFALQLFKGAAISLLVGVVMTGGLLIFLQSLKSLFGLDISEEWYATVAILCLMLLSQLLWMGQIPADEKKHSDAFNQSRFLGRVVRYLFLPLLVLYVLVLYVYGLQILLAWQLPNGGVVWLISVLMFGAIGVAFLLYPRLRFGSSNFEEKAMRWLPIIVLPLVFLMSVSLYRRFSDYGVTTTRLYAALLNLWFYAVCLGLFFNRVRRIHWIALSFGGLFLLTSVLPINFSNLGLRAIKTSLSELWAKNPPPQKPMKQKEYNAWMSKFSDTEAEEINSRLRYLYYSYSKKEIAKWVAPETSLSHSIKEKRNYIEVEYEQSGVDIPIPQGYRRARACDLREKTTTKESVVFTIDEKTNVEVSLLQLKELASHPTFLLVQDLPNGKGRMVFTTIRGHIEEDGSGSYFYNVEGILFTK